MSVVENDLEQRYSGGASNTDPTACLGGAMSTVAGGLVDTGVKNDVWADVSPAEAAAGSTKYRGMYMQNQNDVDTLTDAKIYMSADSPNAGDIIDLAVADEDANAAIEVIGSETTAPVGPAFSHPTTYVGGIAIGQIADGDLGPNEYRGFWQRRTISAGASSGAISNTVKLEGTTV